MPNQNHDIGGGATVSLLSPIVLIGMLVAIILILVLPRKYAIVPFLLCTFFVPLGQQVVLGGVHWLVCRILVLSGLVRLVVMKFNLKGSLISGGFNSVDQAFFGCALFQAVAVTLLYMQSQALINQLGFLIDWAGTYFLLRCLIRDRNDIYTTLKVLAFVTLILAVFMVREQYTLQNAFGALGGVQSVPDVREGKIRSQGVFQHALMAGTFAATLLPLFLLLWKSGKAKSIATIGLVGSTIMTITSQSSTPLLAYVAGIIGVCLWTIRKQMRMVRWAIVITLISLALVMKAPVWFVIAHIDLTGGSSGYHRAELVDQFIRHLGDWWLIGTNNAANWGFDMWDTQNQYVNIGETGGLAAFILFITMITRMFKRLGKARRAVAGYNKQEWLVWFLGCALFAHLTAFFGVNYFDQSKVSWFALMAMISAVTNIQTPTTKVTPKVLNYEEIYVPVG
ncbi:MAG TPA: hypothetical protein VFA74_17940 [Terriglobales bacterium]|nr:hypothetical protein [Terriglobales bacterium]